MRRAVLILALIVGFSAAAAQATITVSFTYLGAYTIGLGSGPIVDVWKMTMDAGEGRLMGSIVLEIGANAGDPNYAEGIPVDPNDPNTYSDPFQAGWRTSGVMPQTLLTPTQDDANALLLPVDYSKCYECDTRLLPAGIGTWLPAAVYPTETNDASIYGVYEDDYVAGVGNLSVSVGVPTAERSRVMDVAQVGVLRGTTTVYSYGACTDDLGVATKARYLVPEPVTGSLLATGAVAVLRRRRRR